MLEEPPENVVRKGRLQPGKLFLVDVENGRIVPDEEVKRTVASRRPYAEWYRNEVVRLDDLPARPCLEPPAEPLRSRQLAFGYTQEDMKVILAPLARNAEEAISSMGNDSPLAVLSDRRPLLYSYFKQLFAQVTNPPIDSIREAVVMSVEASVGSERNLLDETPEHARQLVIANPILRDEELERLRQIDSERLRAPHDRHDLAGRGRAGRARARRGAHLRRGGRGPGRRREHPRPLRSRGRTRARADPAAARRLRAAPPSGARGDAAAGGAHRRVRGAAQRAQRRRARRLRRGRGQPVPHARDARRARRPRSASARDDEGGRAAPRDQGDREGPAEDDLEDGHLDDPVLLRRPGLRGDRALARARRPSLHRHRLAHRRDRDRDARQRHARPPRARLPGDAGPPAAGDRPVRLAARRRAPPVEPGDDRAAPARGPARRLRDLRGVRAARQRRLDAPLDAPRADALPRGAGRRRADRGGRAREGDREALRHGRDVARLDLAGGARDPRGRDEPDRRALEHGRRRRGSGALRRRTRTGTRGARRSSRSRPAASASTRTTSRTRTSCRSRWRRARSPARAGSCRGTRSTATSRACG